jgi:epoxide hydrolase-like predicted phosphatase
MSEKIGLKYRIERRVVFSELTRLGGALDRNEITLYAFNQQLSESLEKPISYVYFERLLLGPSLRKIPVVWNAVHELKNSANLSIIALSNMSEQPWESLQRKYDIQSLFDDTVLSFRYGVTKPDFRIFKLALEKANSSPEECLFLDDTRENIRAAKSLGLQTHLAGHQKETVEFLRSLQERPRQAKKPVEDRLGEALAEMGKDCPDNQGAH